MTENIINCWGVNTSYLNFITNLKSQSYTITLRLIIIKNCDNVFYFLQWLGPLGWCYQVHRCSVSTAHAVLHHHPHQNSGHEVERTAVAISVNNKKLPSTIYRTTNMKMSESVLPQTGAWAESESLQQTEHQVLCPCYQTQSGDAINRIRKRHVRHFRGTLKEKWGPRCTNCVL